MNDFEASKFYVYKGPNYYLQCQALVFNLYVDPEGPPVDHYLHPLVERFPALEEVAPPQVVDLYAMLLIQVLKLDMNLFIDRYAISRDADEYVIAVEYLDARVAEDAVHVCSDWLRAISEDASFDVRAAMDALQQTFHRSVYGGPTAYSLVEAGLQRAIPLFYLRIERQLQWGYGRNQLRGRSTVLHTDGIKDTEFTTFKDDVKDFLMMCGFPTPGGQTCLSEAEALDEAEHLGYPVVAKPVAGHKGEGVYTGIADAAELSRAFNVIRAQLQADDNASNGVIVERHLTGMDHRLLTVAGRLVAAMERIPAYIDGTGRDTIERLIEQENRREERRGDTRAPLSRIEIDDDLRHFIAGQGLSLDSVPDSGRRVYLRRVANVSAGGVSVNVTDHVHPKNVKLAEDIARFFQVTCLGIDVLAEDISKPWDESSFGIIEINAGPGVFMHLVPAIGEPIDVPGKILEAHFPDQHSARIPIVAGNRLSAGFCARLYERLQARRTDIEFASVTEAGLYFNGAYFHRHEDHDINVMLALRNPRLDFAAFSHDKDAILDYGTFHQGADVVILQDPHYAEEVLSRDLLPGGHLIRIESGEVSVLADDREVERISLPSDADDGAVEDALLTLLDPRLEELLSRYR